MKKLNRVIFVLFILMEVFLAIPSYANAAEKSTSVSYGTVDVAAGAITAQKTNQLQSKTYSADKETYEDTDSYIIAKRVLTIFSNVFFIEYCILTFYVAVGLAFFIFLYRYLVLGKDPKHHTMRPGNQKSIKNCLLVIIALTSCRLVSFIFSIFSFGLLKYAVSLLL